MKITHLKIEVTKIMTTKC